MKSSDKAAHMAMMDAYERYYSMNDLAEDVASRLATAKENLVEVDFARSNGFTLRQKGDVRIGTELLYTAICESVKDALEMSDDAVEYISDRYDLDWEDLEDAIHNLAKDVFEVTRTGRLIYIELDD